MKRQCFTFLRNNICNSPKSIAFFGDGYGTIEESGGEIMKKTIGIILLVMAGISIFGAIVNGSLLYAITAVGAHGAGYRAGMFTGCAVLIFGGIALIRSGRK